MFTIEELDKEIEHLRKCISEEDDRDARLSMRMMLDRMLEDRRNRGAYVTS